MAAKEIKIEWDRNAMDCIEGRVFFVNKTLGKTYMMSISGGLEEKVLKAKARIKADLPIRAAEFLKSHQGWEQVDRTAYENVNHFIR